METTKFQSLIRSITKRDLIIDTTDVTIQPEKEYMVYKVLPILGSKISFKWKVAKSEEKYLRSFITAFTTKYREPDPKSYDYTYGGKVYTWAEKDEKQKEYCYFNHASHMFSKAELLEQVQSSFNSPEIETALILNGFYATEYGVGIFAFWETQYVINAIDKMKQYLNQKSIAYTNEFSDARWVYRFKLNIDKGSHLNLLKSFS